MGRAASTTETWLGLLLGDAPESAYDALRRSRLREAGSEAARAVVEAEASAALRLRTQLQEHRRRLAELAALNDLGVRLTSLRDLDALLQEVVTQARRLLDVDLAYLALAEQDRSLLIRVTDGSIGPHLRGVRLEPHSGLAGLVLDTGEPASTQDYLADRQLQHSDVADRIAAEESIRTIAGVPLRLRGDVIGVLMIAQREVRPPSAHEVSLLSSLASLAAVAIENARLFADSTQANEELRRAADAVNRAATLHEQLMDVALRGGGMTQILASLSDVTASEVVFVDATDRIVAVARHGETVTPDGEVAERITHVQPAATFADAKARRTVVTEHSAVVPVSTPDSYYGAISVHPGQPLNDVTLRLLERAAITLALLAAVERTMNEAERRTVDEFLEQLVTRRLAQDQGVLPRALRLGSDLGKPHVVLVIEPDQDGMSAALAWASRLLTKRRGIVGTVSGEVVGLICADIDDAELRADIQSAGTAALAGPAVGINDLANAYDDARACLRAMMAMGQQHRVATPNELGPFRFLLSTAGRDDALRFVKQTIGPLLEHDERRGTALTTTAQHYLANGQRHTETARSLGIHPNTLYQRLSRLDGVLGQGWCHESRALDIQLALRILQLTGPAAAPPVS